MAASKTTDLISSLEVIREKVGTHELGFHTRPLFALCVSTEVSVRGSDAKRVGAEDASWYLQIEQDHVREIGDLGTPDSGDRNPSRPFFAYLKPVHVPEDGDVSKLIGDQLTAINAVFGRLERLMDSFPTSLQEAYCFPHSDYWGLTSPNWWKVLFHLAMHYPTKEFSATRFRWVNYDGGGQGSRDSAGQRRASLQNTGKLLEDFFQFEAEPPAGKDIWPGTIWCELQQDIYEATKLAIDVLIDLIKKADGKRKEPKADRLIKLLEEFDKLAEPEVPDAVAPASVPCIDDGPAVDETDEICTPGMSAAAYEDYDRMTRSCTPPLIIRVGSPFTTPAVRAWCEPLTHLDEEFIPLAMWYGCREFVTYRNMPPEFDSLCKRAGNALPVWWGVVPLMSQESIPEGECCGCTDCAVPIAGEDPVLRWIRFVFDTLRRHRLWEFVTVKFPDAHPDRGVPWAPYGYMKLTQGFFRASAKAIRARFPVVASEQAKSKEKRESDRGDAGIPVAKTKKAILAGLKSQFRKAFEQYEEEVLFIKSFEPGDTDQKVTLVQAYKSIKKRSPGSIKVKLETWTTYVGKALASLGIKAHGRLRGKRAMPDSPSTILLSDHPKRGSD